MTAALTVAEFYSLGVRAEALVSRARPVESVLVASSALVIARHGAALGTPGRLRAVGADSALPEPLVDGTTYYAIPVSGDTMQVAASDGGAAVTLTDAGDGRVEWVEDIEARIESALDHWTGVWDEAVRPHGGPWATYPRAAKQVIAILAADQLLRTHGLTPPDARPSELDQDQVKWARAQLAKAGEYAEGEDATPDVAELGPVAFYAGDGSVEEGAAL
jgi:hypothetical protein